VIRRPAGFVAALLGAVLASGEARAQPSDIEAFADAKASFLASNWQEAVDKFAPLVEGGARTLTDPVILQEARKYYGACLVLVGRAGDATAVFETLLETDPDAQLSESAFPQQVLEVFRGVRGEMEAELRRQREIIRLAEEQGRLREEARIRQEIVSKAVLFERSVNIRPIWQGLLPFGIAQFQNDQNGKGVLFLVSETLMLGTNIASFWLSQPLPNADAIGVNRTLAEVLFYTNITSLAVFGVLLAVGGWDGISNLETESVVTRRLTPEEVRDAIDQGERESGDR